MACRDYRSGNTVGDGRAHHGEFIVVACVAQRVYPDPFGDDLGRITEVTDDQVAARLTLQEQLLLIGVWRVVRKSGGLVEHRVD